MNFYLRLAIATLLSLLVHGALLLSMQPDKIFPRQGESGILQITVQKSSYRATRSVSVKATLPANSKSEEKVKQSKVQSTYTYQQNQIMMAMQQAQLAHQRELRKAAVIAGLSNISFQMRSVIKEKIACVQQSYKQFECTPAQHEKTQILLRQFFDFAIQARELGIAENPMRIDFGNNLGVSITFLQ